MGICYDKEAYQLLKKCSDIKDLTEWNEYRKSTNYAPINLRFADLNNFYLQKAKFQNIDIRAAATEKINFKYADVENLNISMNIFLVIYFFVFMVGFITTYFIYMLGYVSSNFYSLIFLFSAFPSAFFIVSLITYSYSKICFSNILFIISVSFFLLLSGSVVAALKSIGILNLISNISPLLSTDLKTILMIISILFGFLISFVAVLSSIFGNDNLNKYIELAKNPNKVIGIRKQFNTKPTVITDELQKEVSELSKEIDESDDDIEKGKLLFKQRELDEKIDFFAKQELEKRIQETRIENVILELQSPFEYIHQTISKIQWHNRFYYSAIFGLIIIFIYAIVNGYIDQKMATFSSLFSIETLPSFGTIFGVILFYGSPVLIGISLIIYFITQINKNIDKVTELQEQERNIKQIASTIKAKAQIGMSDEEFVKETKALIQKYQEGMMAGMFTKEKTSDKEDKSSSSTYREKMIANGMSKLLMQALKK